MSSAFSAFQPLPDIAFEDEFANPHPVAWPDATQRAVHFRPDPSLADPRLRALVDQLERVINSDPVPYDSLDDEDLTELACLVTFYHQFAHDVGVEPERAIYRWDIVFTHQAAHFIGYTSLRGNSGHCVSSAICAFNPFTLTGVTRSGRVYHLLGDPRPMHQDTRLVDAWRHFSGGGRNPQFIAIGQLGNWDERFCLTAAGAFLLMKQQWEV